MFYIDVYNENDISSGFSFIHLSIFIGRKKYVYIWSPSAILLTGEATVK